MPRLYVVATPIGNLSDISPRALETLKNCALIAAEDTRVTRALLNHFGIDTPCVSNHQHNEENRAGAAHRTHARLRTSTSPLLPTQARPASATPATCSSTKRRRRASRCLPFRARPPWQAHFPSAALTRGNSPFMAFCPARRRISKKSCSPSPEAACPIAVVHESPHRVIDLVRVIAATLPGCRISASCDLTKLYEKTIRGTADEVLAMLLANEKAEKGEYCLVLDLHDVHLAEQQAAPNASLEARIFELMFSGKDMREAGDVLMAQGEKRNDVYRARTAVHGFLSRCMKTKRNKPFPRCRALYPI